MFRHWEWQFLSTPAAKALEIPVSTVSQAMAVISSSLGGAMTQRIPVTGVAVMATAFEVFSPLWAVEIGQALTLLEA